MVISYIENTTQTKLEEMTWNKLLHANLSTKVPFLLLLTHHDKPIFCEKIVRYIPKKRLVMFGTWNEQPVVIKLFYDSRHAKRHYEQELSGVEALLTSGVPTPRVLIYDMIFKKRAYLLVFEEMIGAKNLEDLWQEKSSPEELISVMHAVTIELATQHVLGIMQHDLHFKNFLLKGNQIYTLDGASIENFHELLSKKVSLDHLALFFSQLGVGTESLQQNLFQIYAKARGWLVKRADTQFLYASIKKWNEERKKKYQEKIQRNCSAFARVSKLTSVAMYDRHYNSPTFKNFLSHPESAFAHTQLDVLKAGRSSTVVKINIDGKAVVIKRYNIKNAWHWLRRTFRRTRAAESWKLANTLRLFGISTPKPIAYVEKHFLGLKNRSYFVMEYINGLNLFDYFSEYHKGDAHFEKIASRVVTLIKNLAKMKLSHGDLKATNILIENDQPVLLDLDGMKEHKSQSKANRVCKKEMKRFLKNWKKQPEVKELFEKLIYTSH
ncbi:MAG TPA: lipopolysaccharide kinase InaA family protein [Gammaproteobacteria bacterium]|nr:lipopolysaccharide kinase InaA family protein [Gammaproteobacteria bacterium]